MNPRILTLVTPGTLGTKTLRAEWIIWLRTGAWELARSGLQSQFYNCGGHMSCSPWEHPVHILEVLYSVRFSSI